MILQVNQNPQGKLKSSPSSNHAQQVLEHDLEHKDSHNEQVDLGVVGSFQGSGLGV